MVVPSQLSSRLRKKSFDNWKLNKITINSFQYDIAKI